MTAGYPVTSRTTECQNIKHGTGDSVGRVGLEPTT